MSHLTSNIIWFEGKRKKGRPRLRWIDDLDWHWEEQWTWQRTKDNGDHSFVSIAAKWLASGTDDDNMINIFQANSAVILRESHRVKYFSTPSTTHEHKNRMSPLGAAHKVRYAQGGGGLRRWQFVTGEGESKSMWRHTFKKCPTWNLKLKVMFNFLLLYSDRRGDW